MPYVPVLFWSFRIMVGIGFFNIALMGGFVWLSARRRLGVSRWPLKIAVAALGLPWIAAELGWITAEFGRQPWAIEGVLPTVAAASDMTVTSLLITIAGFTLIYSVLIVIEMRLMLAAIRKGPQPDQIPEMPLAPKPLVAAE